MRIAIVGSGGVGGYFGARLAQAGHDLLFVARGAHLEEMQRSGLRVIGSDGSESLVEGIEVTETAEGCEPVDLAMVCVKTWQLVSTFPILRHLVGPNTAILPLLNGVRSHEVLMSSFDPTQVLGGYCKIISAIDAPGMVRHVGAEPTIHLGALRDEQRERVAEIGAALDVEGIQAKVDEDVLVGLWKKYLFVSSWGTLGAVSRAPIGALRSTPRSRELLLELMRENLALGRARGLGLDDELIDKTMAFVDSLPAIGTASLQRDIAAGRPSELESWTGAAVRISEETTCPAPVHRAFYAALLPLERVARGEEVEGF